MHGRGCSHDMGAGRNFWVSRLARLLSLGREKVADPRDGLEKTYRSASLERR